MNYLKYSLWLLLCVLAVLLLLNELPSITIAGHTMRRVDILADIRTLPTEFEYTADEDTLQLPDVKPAYVDSCREGTTCIEDYSDSGHQGMSHFYQALDEIRPKGRTVRIAVFGDSFIEADILTADLREMLQKKYGGCGVGFVTMTSNVYGFRPTVKHSFGGWSSHAINDSVYFDRKKQGISGHYFLPQSGAYAELRGQDKYASLLDTCSKASIYFLNKRSVTLSARVNSGAKNERTFNASGRLQKMEVDGRIGSIRWDVLRADSTLFYGMAMDDSQGIVVDNFSMRGSSGILLRTMPEAMLRQFNELRPYDLVILQYGLNIATKNQENYDGYQKSMQEAIQHLKTCFPKTGFLLLSIGDRDYRTESGEIRTMPGVKNLVQYQQNIAAQSRIAFWNMFEAMGGEESMATLTRSKPPKANYDYTHINFRGGEHLATLLYNALINGKDNYDRRRAYEKSK